MIEDEWKGQPMYLPRTTMVKNYICSNRFILLHKLGKGGYGLIYTAIDIVTGKEVAVKLEDISKAEKKHLKLEYLIYHRLASDWFHLPFNHCVKIPQVYFYGQDAGFRVLAMELLGVALSEIFVWRNFSFSMKTVCLLAIKIINCIEFFHAKGLLHRDIKCGNLVLGKGENASDLYLIDFGLASSYLDEEGQHIPFSENVRFHGTDLYASINTHDLYENGRRDDMEAIGYLLIYFAKGALPWKTKYPNAEKPEKRQLYGDCKKETSIKTLCKGLPSEFLEYFIYVKKLRFSERPDYDYLRSLFHTVLNENNDTFDDTFDWTPQ